MDNNQLYAIVEVYETSHIYEANGLLAKGWILLDVYTQGDKAMGQNACYVIGRPSTVSPRPPKDYEEGMDF